MNIVEASSKRYTTKAYSPSELIPEHLIEKLKRVLQQSPSSVNSQPWQFFVASTEEGKSLISKGAPAPGYAYNQRKIMDASHVFVFCAKTQIDDAHLDTILTQERLDGRFKDAASAEQQHQARSSFVNLHKYQLKDEKHWMEKQVYLALGMLLLAAATLNIDATPMEGFDPVALDTVLGLKEKGLTSVVVVALGYRSAKDFNASLPKSRLPMDVVISDI